jgi:hypothetical protein
MASIRSDDVVFEGEAPPISERLLIAPTRGRLHHHRVREGRQLEPGTVIGDLQTLRGRVKIRSWMRASFLGWLAHEGELVDAGSAIAIVRRNDAG